MVKSRIVTNDGAPDQPGGIDSDRGATGSAAKGRPRRALNLVDRLVRVPLGFLWMIVLAIVTLPVMIYMTLLYYVVRGASALVTRKRPSRTDRADREERVA